VSAQRTPYFETKASRRLIKKTEKIFKNAILLLLGMFLFIALWEWVAASGKSIPGPFTAWNAAMALLSDPL
jgi:hypothetical protein